MHMLELLPVIVFAGVIAVILMVVVRRPLRIPTHPVGHSDNIRSAIPGYPVT